MNMAEIEILLLSLNDVLHHQKANHAYTGEQSCAPFWPLRQNLPLTLTEAVDLPVTGQGL